MTAAYEAATATYRACIDATDLARTSGSYEQYLAARDAERAALADYEQAERTLRQLADAR